MGYVLFGEKEIRCTKGLWVPDVPSCHKGIDYCHIYGEHPLCLSSHLGVDNFMGVFFFFLSLYKTFKKENEYDQEMPKSQIADQPITALVCLCFVALCHRVIL